MPALLATGLEAWVRERGTGDDQPFAQDPPPGKNPRLHASLRQVLDARTERHRRWAFRAIAAGHPNAVQSRLRKATEASGLDAGRPDRHLFVLRNAPWPNGKVTERETAGLAAKGGVVLPAPPQDLAAFAAIAVLMVEHHPALNAWLDSRRPAHATRLLTAAFAELADPVMPDPAPAAATAPGQQAAGTPVDPHRPPGGRRRRPHPAAGVAPPSPGGLRRLRFRQDGPAAPGHRGVRAARRLVDRPRPQQRPGAARPGLAAGAGPLAARRRRAGRPLPGRDRRGGVDAASRRRPAAHLPAAARLRRGHRRYRRVQRRRGRRGGGARAPGQPPRSAGRPGEGRAHRGHALLRPRRGPRPRYVHRPARHAARARLRADARARRSPPSSPTGCAPSALPTRCSAGKGSPPTPPPCSPRRRASGPGSA